jgi:hypothetical protein
MTRASRFLALPWIFLLAGCSSSGSGDFGQYFQVIKQSLNGSLGKSSISLQQAAAIPYASMGWRLNDGPQNIVVLATENRSELLWTSAAHAVILTEDGRIKRTVGLPHNLSASAPGGSASWVPPAQALSGPYTQQSVADFSDAGLYGVPITCRGRAVGVQAINILGKTLSTRRIQESCDSPSLHWSFVNSYWVDPQTGFTWRSRQHIHPKGDVIETEIFRPPG